MNTGKRIDIIRDWIKDYVETMDTPANCLVVGVSGGIDSSVVSTICSKHNMWFNWNKNISCVYANISKTRASRTFFTTC